MRDDRFVRFSWAALHQLDVRDTQPRAQLLVRRAIGGADDLQGAVATAQNLRDWPDIVSQSGVVGAAAPPARESSNGQDAGSSGAVGGAVRPAPTARAAANFRALDTPLPRCGKLSGALRGENPRRARAGELRQTASGASKRRAMHHRLDPDVQRSEFPPNRRDLAWQELAASRLGGRP